MWQHSCTHDCNVNIISQQNLHLVNKDGVVVQMIQLHIGNAREVYYCNYR